MSGGGLRHDARMVARAENAWNPPFWRGGFRLRGKGLGSVARWPRVAFGDVTAVEAVGRRSAEPPAPIEGLEVLLDCLVGEPEPPRDHAGARGAPLHLLHGRDVGQDRPLSRREWQFAMVAWREQAHGLSLSGLPRFGGLPSM